MDKFHVVAEQGVAHVRVWSRLVFVRMEGAPTARGETRERSPSGRTNPWSPVSSSGGNPVTVLNDAGDVLRFRLRVRQLRRSLAVQVIQEFHLTGVQGLYQLPKRPS